FCQQEVNSQPARLARFSAQSNLALIPVIVTGKSGRHVSGLQKEVFQIEENDRIRSVSVFEEMKTGKPTATAKTGESDSYTNFVEERDHPWRLTAILLDMINTPSLKQL